jgi:hypothetical protein
VHNVAPPAQPVTPPPSNYRQAMPASPVYAPGQSRPVYRQPGNQQPVHREPAYRDSTYAEPARVAPARRPRRGGAGVRVLKTVLVTVLLIIVPLVCGYVAYRYTSDQPLLP